MTAVKVNIENVLDEGLPETFTTEMLHQKVEAEYQRMGLWLSENEGAKFWLNVLTELQNRGVKDILITCVDGLKGFPDAIGTALHRPHGAQLGEVSTLERRQTCHGRSEENLPIGDRG